MLKNNFLILSLFSVFVFAFTFAFKAQSTPSDNFCLTKSYNTYVKNFMTKDGRIIDYEKSNITTSEGQSYIMLRSLIMNDKKTFDLTYKWAKNNLQSKDKLFAWLWGKNKEGKYDVLDENSATDADVDIAFSLILAYEHWKKPQYLYDAKSIINAIWNKETKRIGNYVVLMPGRNQTTDDKNEVNPSYFSPYAFKLFQKYDELHDWNLIVDSSYYYLNKVCFSTKTNLPPNWFYIEDDEIVLDNSEKSDFSYDAVRVFAKVYLDYVKTKDSRAMSVIERSAFFVNEWNKSDAIYTNYTKSGDLRNSDVFIGGIAIILPAITTYDPNTANEIYHNIVEPKIQDVNYWSNKNDYYGKNLAWFGLYLFENNLKGCDIKK